MFIDNKEYVFVTASKNTCSKYLTKNAIQNKPINFKNKLHY